MRPFFTRRGALMRRFRRWLYKLVCEQAAIAGEIALWVPTQPCAHCQHAVLPGAHYCSACGAAQPGTPTRVDSRNTGPHTFTVTQVMRAYRASGAMPAKAYIDRLKKVEGDDGS